MFRLQWAFAYLAVLACAVPSAVEAQPAPIRNVRTLGTEALDVNEPADLAYSVDADHFLLIDSPAGTKSSSRINVLDFQGQIQNSFELQVGFGDPVNIAYDDTSKNLFGLSADASIVVRIGMTPGGAVNPQDRETISTRNLGLNHNPSGITVDPASGDLFVLDSGAGRVLRVSPGPGRSFSRATLSETSLDQIGAVELRGIAVDPESGNLFLANPGAQELYEITQDGQLIAVRDLVVS